MFFKTGPMVNKIKLCKFQPLNAAFKCVYKSLYQQLETHDMILSDNRNKDDIYSMITCR